MGTGGEARGDRGDPRGDPPIEGVCCERGFPSGGLKGREAGGTGVLLLGGLVGEPR